MEKSWQGNFFEDFSCGQRIVHAVPRTISTGDVALYSALYGMRFAIQSSDAFAQACGLRCAPIDNLLLFNVIFGKSVPEISLNAVANLGYADCRFLVPAWPGDSFTARSEVLGLRENSNGKTGIVYVRTTGYNQHNVAVLSFIRWVMVNRRAACAIPSPSSVPEPAAAVAGQALCIPEGLEFSGYDRHLAGSANLLEDYQPGEKINHIDGMTIEAAEHQLATRLYQNTARGHFDGVFQKTSRFGQRIVYGGHIISLARALSFNGLQNGCFVAAINGGRHVNPAAAGDTIYCWSEILDKHVFSDRLNLGALRIRTIATKDTGGAAYPAPGMTNDAAILLDLDYWVLMPRGSTPSINAQ